MRMGEPGVPTVEQYSADALQEGEKLGLCGLTASCLRVRGLQKVLDPKGVAICTLNLEDELWTENRPPLPATPARLLPAAYAGATPAEKLARLRRSEARRVGKGSSSRSPTTTQKRTESRAHRTTEPETS